MPKNVKITNLESIAPLIDNVRKKYVEQGMTFGWKSNSSLGYDMGHWNNNILHHDRLLTYDHQKLPYINEHPEIKKIWEHVTKNLGPRILIRAYCNGYTYGTDAYYHQDDTWITEFGDDAVSETIMLYLNPQEWDPNWGGETSFLDDMRSSPNFIGSVYPKPYRAVIFDSDIWHSARNLTRACPHLRSILAFKTASPKVNVEYVDWIRDRTNDIPHSGGNFFFHLYGTAMILAKEKAPAQAVKAGLFHSVYDTEYFKADLGVTREEVRELIGETEEELVYIFCNTKNRFDAFINNTGKWKPFTRYCLLKIEKANLEEQLPRSTTDQQRWSRERKIEALNTELEKFTVKSHMEGDEYKLIVEERNKG